MFNPITPPFSPNTIHFNIAQRVYDFNVKERQLARISPISLIKYSHVNNSNLVVYFFTCCAHFIRGLGPFYHVRKWTTSRVLCGLSIPVTPTPSEALWWKISQTGGRYRTFSLKAVSLKNSFTIAFSNTTVKWWGKLHFKDRLSNLFFVHFLRV